MISYRSTWMLVAVALLLAACGSEQVDVLKSPCAGIAGSPCGPKRDVNGWWLHDTAEHS